MNAIATTPDADKKTAGDSSASLTGDVLILPDGRVLAHNLTPAFTELLAQLRPDDPRFAARRAAAASLTRGAPRRTGRRAVGQPEPAANLPTLPPP